MRDALVRGSLVLVSFDPTQGHEQRGARPAVVVSSPRYLSSVRGLVIVVPITSVDRGWPHHVLIGGNTSALRKRSFAMTEQPRTISQERIRRHSGSADERTLAEVDRWLRDFLAL
ncbi:MAG: type II toxin-antitoxin system PemK/MazF family toxin [Mycobacteriales bacterium]